MHRQRVDATALATTAWCTCGWRDLANDRTDARRRLHTHVLACHPEQSNHSRRAANIQRQRQEQRDAR